MNTPLIQIEGRYRRRGRRGSILIVSIILMIVAGLATLSWLAFVSNAHRAGIRDRARLTAFYAAESGVEQVVDYFNNPLNFTGSTPAEYDTEKTQPATLTLPDPEVTPDSYALFEPYIMKYEVDKDGNPVYDANGNLVVTAWTYFAQPNAATDSLVSQTSKIPTCELDISEEDALVFLADAVASGGDTVITNATSGSSTSSVTVGGRELARVKKIRLVHPTDVIKEEGSLPPGRRVVTKVEATGETPEGIEVTVEVMLSENPTLDIRSPGAIISLASVDYNGNFDIHWGEVWAQEDILLPANFEIKVPQTDPRVIYKNGNPPTDIWFKVRTTGQFLDASGTKYADGRQSTGFAATPIPDTMGDLYYTPFLDIYLYRERGKKSKFEYYENLKQHQNLDFPRYKYEDWKTFVQAYGFGYYWTDTAGVIYGVDDNPDSATYGDVVGKSYDEWFNIDPESPEYDVLRKKIVFIDTVPVDDEGNPGPSVDGVPLIDETYYPRNPKNPEAYMPTIRISGKGTHSRGAMFIAANVDMMGMGNPPNQLDVPGVEMPNGQEPPNNERFDIFHNGLFYSWGWVDAGGQRTIYGSVYTEGGYSGGGNPEVYYNHRLKDGSWLNLNTSRVNRMLWAMGSPGAGAESK